MSLTPGLSDRFAYHPADTEEKRVAHGNVRAMCRNLAEWLDVELPDSREKSLALTAVQEAMMWANAAVAIHPKDRDKIVDAGS